MFFITKVFEEEEEEEEAYLFDAKSKAVDILLWCLIRTSHEA